MKREQTHKYTWELCSSLIGTIFGSLSGSEEKGKVEYRQGLKERKDKAETRMWETDHGENGEKR